MLEHPASVTRALPRRTIVTVACAIGLMPVKIALTRSSPQAVSRRLAPVDDGSSRACRPQDGLSGASLAASRDIHSTGALPFSSGVASSFRTASGALPPHLSGFLGLFDHFLGRLRRFAFAPLGDRRRPVCVWSRWPQQRRGSEDTPSTVSRLQPGDRKGRGTVRGGPALRFCWSGRLRDQVDDVDRCREIGHIREAVLHSSFERIPDGRYDGQ